MSTGCLAPLWLFQATNTPIISTDIFVDFEFKCERERMKIVVVDIVVVHNIEDVSALKLKAEPNQVSHQWRNKSVKSVALIFSSYFFFNAFHSVQDFYH